MFYSLSSVWGSATRWASIFLFEIKNKILRQEPDSWSWSFKKTPRYLISSHEMELLILLILLLILLDVTQQTRDDE